MNVENMHGEKIKIVASCWSSFTISSVLSQMYTGLRVKYPFFLSVFNDSSIFSIYSRKIFTYQISRKIRPSGKRCVLCGRRDMTELTVAFRNFANATKSNKKFTVQLFGHECKIKKIKVVLRENSWHHNTKDVRFQAFAAK